MSLPQWAYLLLAAAIGIPTVIYGGLMALVGFLLGIIALGAGGVPDGWGSIAFLMFWSGGGLLGLCCWLWISWRYLRRGRAGLQGVGAFAWVGLAAGVIAASLLAWMMLDGILDGDLFDVPTLLFTGPGLLLPALWLGWQRWRPVSE